MKNVKKLLMLLAACFSLSVYSTELVWDFAKASYPVKMQLQGKSTVQNGVLNVANGSNTNPEGIASDGIMKTVVPEGDFTLTIEFKMNVAELDKKPDKALMMLADSKADLWPPAERKDAGANSGFGIGLYRNSGHIWVPNVFLGYGDRSAVVVGSSIEIGDENFHTITLRYFVRGEVQILFDGKLNSTNRVPAGILAPALKPFHIGDRAGASYWCLEGAIRKVSLDMPKLEPLTLAAGARSVFERTEAMQYRVKAGNQSNKPETVEVAMVIDKKSLAPQSVTIPANSAAEVRFALPARLRPGLYPVKVSAKSLSGNSAVLNAGITVVAEENPEAIPVFMWQAGNPELLAELGFTAQLWVLSDPYATQDGDPALSYADLDASLRHGIRLADLLRYAENNTYLNQYARVDRQGKAYPRRNLDASNPELRSKLAEAATRAASAYGDHPGLTMLMVATEVRDGSQIAYNGTEAAEYRKFSGKEIPGNALGRSAPPVEEITDFPTLGNLDSNVELYNFFRWWWVDGDGWNPLHRLLQESYRKGLGKRAGKVLTFYDPAQRVPPVFGSAAGLDMLNQWTYSYASPIKIASAVDEERAMARGNGGQKLMKTVQVIWYRDPPAPPDKQVTNPPAWVKEYPDAAYITIAPDHLQESVWSELSRRLDVLSFHGYGSLVERDDRPWNSYRYTNPESRVMFKKLVDNLIRPLGPVLKVVPERPMETAVLYTLGSNLFGRTGSWGWSWGPDAEMHQLLQRAQLDPGVLFDEDILAGRLDGVKLLALPNCSIMDQKVIEAIWKFQDAGGLVIGDGDLNPLILPDFTVEYQGAKEAKEITKKLAGLVSMYFAADSPEVATHVRTWKKSDYLFAVNDRRGYGDYVGMYGNVQEKGLPLSCEVTLKRSDVKAIYDLSAHKPVAFTLQGNQCRWKIDYTTNDGRLYLALPQKIAKITVDAPANAALEKALEVTVQIMDEEGKPVEAVLPVELKIHASNGDEIIGSGYYAVTDGKKTITILPSCNDLPGEWKIEVRDLAAGLSASRTVTVK